MDTSDPRQALLDALALKDVARAGWVRAGHPDPESVAAHSWGVAWLALALLPPGLDRGRALAYAVIHDLAEAWTGDVTPHDGIPTAEKHASERAAMVALCDRLARPDLLALWDAYEAQADEESRFVRQLDRLDMALQASRYAAQTGLDPADFLRSAHAGIDDPGLTRLMGPPPAR